MPSGDNRENMRTASIFLILLVCMAAVVTAGCAETKDLGSVTPPTTVTGTGPATVKLISLGGAHTFHVTSFGEHAGLIISITGTKRDTEGRTKSGTVVRDAMAPGNIDASKTLNLPEDVYTLEVLTTNDKAPWSIQIS